MSDAGIAAAKQTMIKDGVCYMCTHRCSTKVHVQQGEAVKIEMVDENVRDICPRWKAQLDFVYHPDRLKYPLKRTGERGSGSFARISWDEALDITADQLQKIKKDYGPESVVFWIAYTKEPRPYFRRLTHAFGSPNFCTESSSCFSATWLAANLNYGDDYGYLVQQSWSIPSETRCKIIWGNSVVNSFPQWWNQHVKARENGLKLIVVDPRRTTIASMADLHLQVRPGTDGALALGMMNVIINEQLYDKEFVEKWTVGFNELKELVQEYPIGKVEEITWVPAAKIKEAAVMYATQKPSKIGLSVNSTVHHANGVQNHRAITLLPALTGNFEVKGGNQRAPDFPPKRNITLNDRLDQMPPGLGTDRFPVWTKRYYREMESNVIADRIENASPYPIKALFGAGLNIMFFPNSRRFAECMKKLDFIVVTDYFHTQGTQLADIVLPISTWLERHILADSPGGQIDLIEPAIDPVGESWPEFKVFSEIAKRLGFGDEFWNGDFDECHNYMFEPSGITMDELRKHPEGIKYPVPDLPERNYKKAGFKTASGKVEIYSSVLKEHGYEPLPVYKEPVEGPISRPDLAASFPLVLMSGGRTLQYTHSLFRNIPRLRKSLPEPLLEINPADAKSRSIQSGDTVVISTPRGSVEMKANVTDIILPGVVHAPHHWPEAANVNIVIDDRNLDPISGFPPFKSQLCQVAKA